MTMASASASQFSLQVFCVLLLLFSNYVKSDQTSQKSYIIYMGISTSTIDVAETVDSSSHLQFLSSIIPSYKTALIGDSYSKSFKGFSAMLTDDQASLLSGREEVVSIFPDPVLELHTTRSWDFLNLNLKISNQNNSHIHSTSDVIVGIIDTGIWPESPSFSDHGLGKIPSKWKGVCMEGSDFKKSNCNRKLIGARFYENQALKYISPTINQKAKHKGSPRDELGHGTHTASIAAGNVVNNASYYGLASGLARGGLPSARLAIYKACTIEGCQGSTLLKAIDDAIHDGVDIISISIGLDSALQNDFLSDPIGIGAFHAAEKGVMLVASAGNEGPLPFTVVNTAPWIFTVAASSIDRDFQSTVILGNKKTFQGYAINLSPLSDAQTYPLAFGESVAAASTSVPEARNCIPGSLDSKKVAGKIVVCLSGGTSRNIQRLYVEDVKAKGLVLIDEEKRSSQLDSGLFPFTEVENVSGSEILSYINSTKNPTATILATAEINKVKPAPVVADFSSRGPGVLTDNILKPDIIAPGVSILAAIVPKMEVGTVPHGEKAAIFGIRSGTSMSCPHVTGAAAFIKNAHHDWTSSMIKSALMTTATVSNNMGKPLTNTMFDYSNPHEIGAGEINPVEALDPGLVFETTTQDYLNFLCHFGYKEKALRSMTNTTFSCPKPISQELISNVNYPSISIGKLDKTHGAKRVTRVARNIGLPNATYVSSVHAPRGILVKVQPEKLVFTEDKKRASFQVSFDGKYSSKGYKFGSITWSDGFHRVRITFAANIV